MIYRRPIRDVVEERHGRTCGIHVFVFYMLALTAVLSMSTACLSATEAGYFRFDQVISTLSEERELSTKFTVGYETTYGWRSMCSDATARYTDAQGVPRTADDDGCFGLEKTVNLRPFKITLAAGSTMTADTGLAVALGHAVAAAVSAIHILFFLMLYLNIDPVPVRGYPYMRGLGLMSALASFYLLFTCVVSFYFGVKGSLDLHMETSSGLRPSWAYVLTVLNVTTMVIVGMLACQDDEVDAAIATPQYTSSSRDEDTVKRASGKLLHLRSKSSDTISDGIIPSLAQTQAAPSSTVHQKALVANSMAGIGTGPHPAASSAFSSTTTSAGVGGTGPSVQASTSHMSAAAASAVAHAASAYGRVASSPVQSAGGLSSWTGRVSGPSPARRRAEGRNDDSGRHGVQDMNTGDNNGGNVPGHVSNNDDTQEGATVARDGVEEYESDEDESRRTSLTHDTYASNNTVLLDAGFYTGAGLGAVTRELEVMNGTGSVAAVASTAVSPATSHVGGVGTGTGDSAFDLGARLEREGDVKTKLCETDDGARRLSGPLPPPSFDGFASPSRGRASGVLLEPENVRGDTDSSDARNHSSDDDDLEAGIGLETSPISTSAAIMPVSARQRPDATNNAPLSAAPARGTIRGTVPGTIRGTTPRTSASTSSGTAQHGEGGSEPARGKFLGTVSGTSCVTLKNEPETRDVSHSPVRSARDDQV